LVLENMLKHLFQAIKVSTPVLCTELLPATGLQHKGRQLAEHARLHTAACRESLLLMLGYISSKGRCAVPEVRGVPSQNQAAHGISSPNNARATYLLQAPATIVSVSQGAQAAQVHLPGCCHIQYCICEVVVCACSALDAGPVAGHSIWVVPPNGLGPGQLQGGQAGGIERCQRSHASTLCQCTSSHLVTPCSLLATCMAECDTCIAGAFHVYIQAGHQLAGIGRVTYRLVAFCQDLTALLQPPSSVLLGAHC
jgi:hypothetical protein